MQLPLKAICTYQDFDCENTRGTNWSGDFQAKAFKKVVKIESKTPKITFSVNFAYLQETLLPV